MTISWWESIESMTGAGADPRHPHHLPRDAEFLVELPKDVQVLTLLTRRGELV